ncbi:MAG: hypothetical protein VB858_02390, partial [Planctomycetaceae bacterium]
MRSSMLPSCLLTAALLSISGCQSEPETGVDGEPDLVKGGSNAVSGAPVDDETSIETLTGKSVKLGTGPDGRIVLADFRQTETGDDDLALLQGLPSCARVIVSGPEFTDAGLQHL